MARRPLVIAHRGASADAPENTLAAFALAQGQGAEMIEFDVRPAGDGTIVVCHDPTLARWGGQATPIEALPWPVLARFSLGGERIPTLHEVLDWAGPTDLQLNIELKHAGIEQGVATLVRAAGLDERVIISSFDRSALATMRVVAPRLKRGVLMPTRRRKRIDLRPAWPLFALRREAAWSWHPNVKLPLLHRYVPFVQGRGYQVHVWTVDAPATMRSLARAGVDGIMSNRPALLKQVLDTLDT